MSLTPFIRSVARSIARHFHVLHDAGDQHTITRSMEAEADAFGLNAARQPDGFAQAAVQLSEYRKMHPGPVEEFLFFDHPSGWHRIHRAMIWKAENLDDPMVRSGEAIKPAGAR